MDGWLVVDKPAGPTSHDVVARARRRLDTRKIGHTGTLDPMATGVVVLAVGKATRLIGYLIGHKTYLAEVAFGRTTDSLDATGRTVAVRPWEGLDLPAIQTALRQFEGRIEQIPPMVSAVHHEGKRLYELARQGVTVERQARAVTIDRLRIRGWEPPVLSLEVGCSAGTYIRTLADDLGRLLGPGAHLTGLRRLEAHGFTLDQALVEEAIAQAHLLPLDLPLAHLPEVTLSDDLAWRFRVGQTVPGEPAGALRVYVEDGFAGIAWGEEGYLHPKVNLLPATGSVPAPTSD